MKTTNNNKTWITAVVTAFAASLCCITPVLSMIAGIGGIASTFSWLEPVRPFLIGITALVLGFAWYQKLKPRAEMACVCEDEEKPSFFQTKTFLGLVTAFAILMLSFPYYSHIFYPKTSEKVIVVSSENIVEADFEIAGMTCKGCEEHVKHAVTQLPGFVSAEANHKTGKAVVKFDKTQTNLDRVIAAINATGYKVVKSEIKNN
ncbi:MAG: hypothetical protein KatS3mg027_0773 [Bacteroidia bacterium]|nr:MAG: hypothetical protein KatS3mg027_0773 [Bacteroidia bacterium]